MNIARKLKYLLLLVSMNFLLVPSYGQLFYEGREYGIVGGASEYFGDLNTNYGFKHIRPAAGAFMRVYINPYISVRGSFMLTQVGYKDSYNKDFYKKMRNLSFESYIGEVSAVGEFNFFHFETGNDFRRFTPYVIGGVGMFYYNPTAEYQGQKYDLRDLGTEGQNMSQYKGRKYSNYSVCFPVGVGVKMWIVPGVNLGLELVNRFTLTDYLDDVSKTYVGADKFSYSSGTNAAAQYLQDPSIAVNGQKLGTAGKQRGENATKDQYFMAQLTLSIQLKTYKCPSYTTRANLYEF